MCWDPYDCDAKIFENTTRTARKTHRCASGCTIQPGEQYRYTTWLEDGAWVHVKECSVCLAAARALGDACRMYWDESTDPPVGYVLHELNEHLDAGELESEGVPDDVISDLRDRRDEIERRRSAAA